MNYSLSFFVQCLAAGSSIMNREAESASMRPLARALTKNLDSLRHILREQCFFTVTEYTERVRVFPRFFVSLIFFNNRHFVLGGCACIM